MCVCDKYCQQIKKYFAKNPMYNAAVHVLTGIGIGIILARPLAGTHPVRWGIAFLTVALLGHLWAGRK